MRRRRENGQRDTFPTRTTLAASPSPFTLLKPVMASGCGYETRKPIAAEPLLPKLHGIIPSLVFPP